MERLRYDSLILLVEASHLFDDPRLEPAVLILDFFIMLLFLNLSLVLGLLGNYLVRLPLSWSAFDGLRLFLKVGLLVV